MASADNVRIAKDAAGTMRGASRLAEPMARVLRDEVASDVAIATALLTSGIVECYSDDWLEGWICLKLYVALKTAWWRRRAMVQA
jgi:hypothetical protein